MKTFFKNNAFIIEDALPLVKKRKEGENPPSFLLTAFQNSEGNFVKSEK